MSAPAFTAARLAAWLHRSPQAVRKALRGTEPTIRICNGVEAAAWTLEQIPLALKTELSHEAKARKFLNVETMLANAVSRWEPPIPLAEVSDQDIENARKLRDALKPWLTQKADPDLAIGELEAQAVEHHRRVFSRSRPITTRHWRELFSRTLKRDAGAEDFDRLEIYLPNNPQRKKLAVATNDPIESELGNLSSFIDAIKSPASEIEKIAIWRRAFEELEILTRGGTSQKRAARLVRDLLALKAPYLSPTRSALFKAFDRKLEQWRKDPLSLGDRRAENGRDDFVFPQCDVDYLESLIVFQYGEFDQAWKRAWRTGKLSAETRSQYLRNGGRYMPARLKESYGKLPLWIYKLHRRKRDFNSMKAHFTMKYDDLNSLDCISADDVTLPVWFYFEREDGSTIMTRGQCLVFIDLVSRRILGYSLQPDKNYNALVIYTQTTSVFAESGVPKALLFERGIWEKSKLITGSDVNSIGEVTEGLKRFGVEFFHAHSPEGKSEMENVMGRIQDLMEGEAGYGGRDERRDRPDWIKRQLAEVQSASGVHPSRYFYSFEMWNKRLGEIFREYNELAQLGQHMRGKTPEQLYVERWNTDDPPIKLPAQLRWLFASKHTVIVKPDGFKIRSGNRTFSYFGPEISHFTGHQVFAWFDPAAPDLAIVTDMKTKNAVAVPLHQGVDRLQRLTNPQSTELADACARREGQVQGLKARYNVLKSKFELPYRQNLITAQEAETGITVESLKIESQNRNAEKLRRTNRAAKVADDLGVPRELVGDDPDKLAALERLRSFRNQEKEPS